MTNIAHENPEMNTSRVHTTDAARKRLKKRYGVEWRFRAYGIAAITLAALCLVALMTTIISSGLPAFTYNYVKLPLDLTANRVDPQNPAGASYNKIIRDALKAEAPFAASRNNRRTLYALVSGGSNVILQRQVLADPELLGETREIEVPLSDFADLYVKGLITDRVAHKTGGELSFISNGDEFTLSSSAPDFKVALSRLEAYLKEQSSALQTRVNNLQNSEKLAASRVERQQNTLQNAPLDRKDIETQKLEKLRSTHNAVIATLSQQKAKLTAYSDRLNNFSNKQLEETLNHELPSFFVIVNGGTLKINRLTETSVTGEVLVPFNAQTTAAQGQWQLQELTLPEAERKFSDKEIAYTDYLVQAGAIESHWNSIFFNSGASREPEMAGIWGAVVGSFWTMLVTLALSFPIGVAAAIYLEEFAPKNRWTHLIEVNINNLAAVPSIVFGLLGLAVFLNVFGLPRSAPVVGGMVLALMTLPTIIIASRAAIQAVPPSIREAALGVGASRLQAVFHHVLPLAMPGILTGTIIGMAQALGETAPLLMIGMVAFIVDIPVSPVDPSTVLPVQIFMWADFPEPAFQQKTSAAIMVLLGFLVSMNAIAIFLRKRFERRW
nr:phosphate ABC transporter permease PstA [Pseudovibrio stylochi]